MSISPDVSHRARLIREMSRDLNRSNRSGSYAMGSDHGSIPNSTASDFDPDNEALMSTRQLDNTTNRLPELRASAKKFGRRNNPEVDFVMNTSAIEKAFPDFSMPGSSSDEGSDSIEIGRGGKRVGKGAGRGLGASREFSSNPPFSIGDDSIRSSKAIIGSFEVLSTPPARPRMPLGTDIGNLKQNTQTKRAISSQKENQRPSPPLAKTSDYVSNSNKSNSSRERRTLAEIHARVTSEDDGSLVSEERPPTVNLTAKSSRFVGARNRQTSGVSGAGESIPSKFTTTEDFLQGLTQGTGAARNSQNSQTARAASSHTTAAAGATQQSFLLPDLPNLSELVSGVFNDGTPVFSRSGKPRSRFASSTFPRGNGKNKPDHVPIESIPVPDEERALLVSLRLLQDKVAGLENDKAEAEKRAEELKAENDILKAQKTEGERLKRSDSALGMADSGSDGGEGYGRRSSNWVTEKTRLESTVKSLQTRLDSTNRKVSVSEITIKNLTQERDSAVSQLGVAYYTSEGLKTENEALRTENETLKSRLAQIETERENETKSWNKKEAALKRKVERREEAVREVREMTREIWELRQDGEVHVAGGKRKGSGAKRQPQVGSRGSEPENRKSSAPTLETNDQERKATDEARKPNYKGGRTNSNTITRGRGASDSRSTVLVETTRARSRSMSRRRPSAATVDNKEIQKKKRTRQVVVEEIAETDSSDPELDQEPTGNAEGPRTREETNESLCELAPRTRREGRPDNTYLSFLEVGNVLRTRPGRDSNFGQDAEIGRLRKTLEDERAAHRNRVEAVATEEKIDRTPVEKPTSQPTLPRKSSMKDLTANSKTGILQSELDEHTGRSSVKVGMIDQIPQDETIQSKRSTTRRRHHSDTSVISKTNVRRRLPAEDMTSAFIVPDITIRGLPTEKDTGPILSPAAQHILDGLTQHDGPNCTVCRRITSHGHGKECHIGGEKVRETLRVPRPVPVSERTPRAGEWNEEPTVRPSQPPANALAIVMKGLEDELSHLKMELAQHQAVYNSHDASLSKRKRKSIFIKIEALLKTIDAKADQIYALYDVLEGQKANGHEITEEEVEVTLNTIGINPMELRLRGGELNPVRRNKVAYADEGQSEGSGEGESSVDEEEAHEDGDNDDDMELPWEGIEDTDI